MDTRALWALGLSLSALALWHYQLAGPQAPGVRLAACAGDCIDADGKKIEGRMVTIRQGGVRDAQELLLEAFQTGSFYGPLSWNKLFDARLFKEKGIHRALQTDMQMADFAFRQGEHLHIRIGHTFENAGDVFLVT